jgi:hypothetical protein
MRTKVERTPVPAKPHLANWRGKWYVGYDHRVDVRRITKALNWATERNLGHEHRQDA